MDGIFQSPCAKDLTTKVALGRAMEHLRGETSGANLNHYRHTLESNYGTSSYFSLPPGWDVNTHSDTCFCRDVLPSPGAQTNRPVWFLASTSMNMNQNNLFLHIKFKSSGILLYYHEANTQFKKVDPQVVPNTRFIKTNWNVHPLIVTFTVTKLFHLI